jgi:hypothetical protein
LLHLLHFTSLHFIQWCILLHFTSSLYRDEVMKQEVEAKQTLICKFLQGERHGPNQVEHQGRTPVVGEGRDSILGGLLLLGKPRPGRPGVGVDCPPRLPLPGWAMTRLPWWGRAALVLGTVWVRVTGRRQDAVLLGMWLMSHSRRR